MVCCPDAAALDASLQFRNHNAPLRRLRPVHCNVATRLINCGRRGRDSIPRRAPIRLNKHLDTLAPKACLLPAIVHGFAAVANVWMYGGTPPSPAPLDCVQTFALVQRYRFCPAMASLLKNACPVPQVAGSVVPTVNGFVELDPAKSTIPVCAFKSLNPSIATARTSRAMRIGS